MHFIPTVTTSAFLLVRFVVPISKATFSILCPVAVCCAWVYNAELEHKHHLDHLRAENDGHLPEVPGYEYMNRRNKPFPWGMNSLFFNPHVSCSLPALCVHD